MDALDASQEMLNVARRKGIYKVLLCAYVEQGRSLPIEDSKYLNKTYTRRFSLTNEIYLIYPFVHE